MKRTPVLGRAEDGRGGTQRLVRTFLTLVVRNRDGLSFDGSSIFIGTPGPSDPTFLVILIVWNRKGFSFDRSILVIGYPGPFDPIFLRIRNRNGLSLDGLIILIGSPCPSDPIFLLAEYRQCQPLRSMRSYRWRDIHWLLISHRMASGRCWSLPPSFRPSPLHPMRQNNPLFLPPLHLPPRAPKPPTPPLGIQILIIVPPRLPPIRPHGSHIPRRLAPRTHPPFIHQLHDPRGAPPPAPSHHTQRLQRLFIPIQFPQLTRQTPHDFRPGLAEPRRLPGIQRPQHGVGGGAPARRVQIRHQRLQMRMQFVAHERHEVHEGGFQPAGVQGAEVAAFGGGQFVAAALEEVAEDGGGVEECGD